MSRTIPVMKFVRMIFTIFLISLPGAALASPYQWALAFPKTDFTQLSIDLSEIQSVGAARDSIPAIQMPKFQSADTLSNLGSMEPLLRVDLGGDVRGYPLRILLWHELVNDIIEDVPVLISYSPLTGSAVVFEREIEGQIRIFRNTGLLRHYGSVIYDVANENWWQQFSGKALVGKAVGKRLKQIASRVVSFEEFKMSDPKAQVLVPSDPNAWDYGKTPFVRMDSRNDTADQYPYAIPDGIGPLDRVVVIGEEAWPLARLRDAKRIETENVVLKWTPGMNSIHDTLWIPFGRDIGIVQAWNKISTGTKNAVFDTPFAFAFAAFHPKGVWHIEP